MKKVYLADILSLSRIPLGILVAILAWQGHMMMACLVLIFGASTDFVDGLVARWEGKPSGIQKNLDIDSMSDLALQISSIVGLGLSGYVAWHWIGIALGAWSPFAILYALSHQGTRLYKAMKICVASFSISAMIVVIYSYLYWGISTNPLLLIIYVVLVMLIGMKKRQRTADWLSIVRIPVSVLIAITAIKGYWSLAFYLIVFAIMTDLFDGVIARRWGGPTKLGNDLDDLSDLSLGIGIIAGLLFTGHLNWPVVITMIVIYVPLAIFFRCSPAETMLRKLGNRGMAIYYPLLIAISIVWYARLAFSTEGASLAAVIEFISLVALSYIKRKRIIGWLHGRP